MSTSVRLPCTHNQHRRKVSHTDTHSLYTYRVPNSRWGIQVSLDKLFPPIRVYSNRYHGGNNRSKSSPKDISAYRRFSWESNNLLRRSILDHKHTVQKISDILRVLHIPHLEYRYRFCSASWDILFSSNRSRSNRPRKNIHDYCHNNRDPYSRSYTLVPILILIGK